MNKTRLTLLIFSLAGSFSGLFAQAFSPVNGTAYPVEIIEWTSNGEDKLAVMQSLLRSCTITFNSANAVVSFGNGINNATYTFFPDGSCESSVKALFIKRSVFGAGRIERSGRDFILYVSMQVETEDMATLIKGKINL